MTRLLVRKGETNVAVRNVPCVSARFSLELSVYASPLVLLCRMNKYEI